LATAGDFCPEKFDLVAGQTHELAIGARRAFQNIDNPEQKKRWLEVPFIGIGISSQVKPLVDGHVLAAAVVTSATMDFALTLLARAIESQTQPPATQHRGSVIVSRIGETDVEAIKHRCGEWGHARPLSRCGR
jgi:multisubunit Na+/H+ antiporter MnhC subunit